MLRAKILVGTLAFSVGDAVQLKKASDDMRLIWLDEKEVENRGSHCLDGSAPGYHFAEGTEDGKFLFWLMGGTHCTDEADCVSYLPVSPMEETLERKPLQNHDVFANYHHVHISTCDLGLYMGDRSSPVEYGGQKLYFQGARILKHIVDNLQNNYTMKEVLVSGGSGGGHALYTAADYFKGLMPTSVTKFGVAPINGWYASNQEDALSSVFELMQMQNTISESCNSAFSETERYRCIDPAIAYKYTQTNTFMTQIFDYTFKWNDNISDSTTTAWDSCLNLEAAAHSPCDNDGVALLQSYLNNYTLLLSTYPKYSENGQGGYLSTCTEHTFFNEDDLFGSYANNGVTVGDAIASWWSSIGTNPAAVWYLPCTLGSAQHAQCESSCESQR